jgi:hypothetical protein
LGHHKNHDDQISWKDRITKSNFGGTMKKTFTLLMLGALTLALTAFGSFNAQAKSDGNIAALQATATPIPTDEETNDDANDNNNGALGLDPTDPNSSVVVWDQFCVRKIPYTILALPENSTFELASGADAVVPTQVVGGNSNQFACESVGTFRNKHIVVCHGPELYSFDLQVNDGGSTATYQVPLKGCPIPPQPEEDTVESTP